MTVQLKKLSPLHKQVISLLAQGVPRQTIALACDITPEYVTMLSSQAVCQEYLKEMTAAADVHLETLFSKSVDVIADTLSNGTPDEKLRAARLQMEATRRLGHHQVSGTIEHKHSLLSLLSSLPAKGIKELPPGADSEGLERELELELEEDEQGVFQIGTPEDQRSAA